MLGEPPCGCKKYFHGRWRKVEGEGRELRADVVSYVRRTA